MGILATNERTHAWMDEGVNTYFQFRYEADKYRFNSVFGETIPKEVKEKSAEDFQAIVYNAINRIPMETPIDTPSENFSSEEEYGVVVYIKTAVWMYLMELQLGKSNVDKAVHAYYDRWKFKHPYPEDMKDAFEKELSKDLTPYFDLLKKKGAL
jgi:aminopeptidase N